MPSSLSNFNQQLIAHRGWQSHYPENSYAGIKAALELGIQHIEIDVQLSLEKIAVVCHDKNLQRLCGVDVCINDSDLSQLKRLSFHEPERLGDSHQPTTLMTLHECAQLIAAYPDAHLYVELKASSIRHFSAQCVLDAVTESLADIMAQVSLISFDKAILELAKSAGKFQRLAPVVINQQQWFDGSFEQLNPYLVFCDIEKYPANTTIDQLPYPVAFYEIDTYEQAVELLKEGAQLIESFCSGELLASHQTHNPSS